MSRFFRRKKEEEKEEVGVEAEPAEIQESTLEKICKKYGRPDLYDPLSKTILAEPRGRDVESLVSEESYLDYSAAASVMLYEGKPELARDSFLMAIELGADRTRSYMSVIENIDIVSEILTDWWKEEGKYEELKKREK
jgi:hypothetical protein